MGGVVYNLGGAGVIRRQEEILQNILYHNRQRSVAQSFWGHQKQLLQTFIYSSSFYRATSQMFLKLTLTLVNSNYMSGGIYKNTPERIMVVVHEDLQLLFSLLTIA